MPSPELVRHIRPAASYSNVSVASPVVLRSYISPNALYFIVTLMLLRAMAPIPLAPSPVVVLGVMMAVWWPSASYWKTV
ncbi:MAG: hypothetical protein QM767_02950 [Anaeromyxobacter sp.]